MRKKVIFETMLVLALAGCVAPRRAQAQFIGYTSPQSAQQKVFSAQTTAQATPVATGSCTPVNGTPCGIPNIGQTVHFLTYTVAGSATTIDIRLEGSFDGTNWITISDDATDLAGGEVVGIGYYPAVRANLVTCAGCGGAVTLTANYSGVSSSPSNPYGLYNPAQQVRKVILSSAPSNSDATVTGIPCPFGSSAGVLVVTSTASFAGSAQFNITGFVGALGASLFTVVPPTGLFSVGYSTPASPCTSLQVVYQHATVGAGTISAYYVFSPPATVPATAQPAFTQNAESVSGTNASVSQFIGGSSGRAARAYLFSVSARCSAGTAQLTVNDGLVQIWSTSATEVSTTTFKYQWTPGLASASPAVAMSVTLGTCGAANVGTLDVQASVF